MVRAAIALGSNLGDRQAALHDAAYQLAAHLAGLTVSDFIDTEPVDVNDQPRFLNAAAVGGWNGTARALLDLLLRIEQAAGRERPFPGAPRTLDLDLILFGAAVIDEPGLTVPHPRFRERGFVLHPLCQIAPDLLDPVTGRSVADLARALDGG
jgi:2-amino-4-hydroxy-6-hydroxymethyldihydropteridine diphosphokinase